VLQVNQKEVQQFVTVSHRLVDHKHKITDRKGAVNKLLQSRIIGRLTSRQSYTILKVVAGPMLSTGGLSCALFSALYGPYWPMFASG